MIGVVSGLVIFLALLSLLDLFIPSPHCRDGWQSHSIGRPGACSHHGGVERNHFLSNFAFIISAFVGFAAGTTISTVLRKGNGASNSELETCVVDETTKVIFDAISTNRKIEFLYLKRNRTTYELRTIQPTDLKFIVPRINSTICVSGYCYLRNEARTFSVKRMRDIRIIA